MVILMTQKDNLTCRSFIKFSLTNLTTLCLFQILDKNTYASNIINYDIYQCGNFLINNSTCTRCFICRDNCRNKATSIKANSEVYINENIRRNYEKNMSHYYII